MAVLALTNRGKADVKWEFVDGSLFLQTTPLPTNSVCFVASGVALPAGNDTQLVVLPHTWHDQRSRTLPMVSVQCVPQPSELRLRGEKLLSKIGINITNTGVVATVDLPPRPTSASPP
jgi:hypothetical protein